MKAISAIICLCVLSSCSSLPEILKNLGSLSITEKIELDVENEPKKSEL